MQLTLEPTEEFFCLSDGTPVRAWSGTDQDGRPVIALIAAITVAGDSPISGLVSIPPPDGESARLWAAEVLSRRY